MNKVLVVSTNSLLWDKVVSYLSAENIVLSQTDSIADYMSRIKSGSFCLVIINTDICTDWASAVIEIRQTSNIPIMITAKAKNVTDEVTALRLGADAYMAMPIEPLEVSVHIQSFVRRYLEYSESASDKHEHVIQLHGLSIDVDNGAVYRDTERLVLTKTEFNLLHFFVRHKGQTLSKEQIYSGVWNNEYIYDDRNIITHIQRLRQKIERNPERPVYIHTIRGFGYQFDYQPE